MVDKSGDFYYILDFIHAYEHANWDDIAIMMVKYDLELDEITTAFVDALVWYKTLLDAIAGEEEETKKA